MRVTWPKDAPMNEVLTPGLRSDIAFDVIEAIPQWCRLEKRSGTLNGSLPLRAARACPPLMQGNEAGFQVRLRSPLPLRVRGGRLTIALAEAAIDLVSDAAPRALSSLVNEGLVVRNGVWHRLFKQSAIAERNGRLYLWSGCLVRPRPGISLLVSRAFNQHARIDVVEHLVSRADGFTPLVIEVDATGLAPGRHVLEHEIACVTPLTGGADIEVTSLREAPQVGVPYVEFHNRAYYEERRKSGVSGRYVRHKAREVVAAPNAACTVATIWPRQHVARGSFSRVATARGLSNRRLPGGPQYAMVRAVLDLHCEWNGHAFTRFGISGEPTQVAAARQAWLSLYGVSFDPGGGVENQYFAFTNEQPFFNFVSPALCQTPPGWVSLVDGYRLGQVWGMRGVIENEWYTGVATAYKFDRPTMLRLRRPTPLLRIIPVPKALLGAGFHRVGFSSGAA